MAGASSVAGLSTVSPRRHGAFCAVSSWNILWTPALILCCRSAGHRLRHDRPARQLVKSARWLLLKNRRNVTRPALRVRLQELLAANRKLFVTYVLKDDLKHLWDYLYPGAARRFWKGWYDRAIRSRIEPLQAFARRLQGYLPGILAHCRFPLNTSFQEGMNNTIKVIKRMAYGYRDDEYFFLRIREAYPGNTG